MDKIIHVSKQVDGIELMNTVAKYIQSRINNCTIEAGSEGNTYTILVTPATNVQNKMSKPIFIIVQIILHEDSCAISYEYTKARPAFNAAFAIVAAPICLPLSGVLLGTAAYRIMFSTKLRNDLFRYIACYVNK